MDGSRGRERKGKGRKMALKTVKDVTELTEKNMRNMEKGA